MSSRAVGLGVLGIILTIGGGLVHGRLSSRWGPRAELQNIGDHLSTLPETIGNWQLVNTEELSDHIVNMLECTGYVIRTYVERNTGTEVKLALLSGPPGPIAVHTPEVCYNARDWILDEQRTLQEIMSPQRASHTFWTVSMQANDAAGNRLRIYYAWTDNGHWQAADAPRYEFARSPFLVKLQLAGSIPRGASSEENPCRSFLEALTSSGWNVVADENDEIHSGEHGAPSIRDT